MYQGDEEKIVTEGSLCVPGIVPVRSQVFSWCVGVYDSMCVCVYVCVWLASDPTRSGGGRKKIREIEGNCGRIPRKIIKVP